ncbi:MAG: DUF4136 domain-containing protein [Flavobacteriaceae bacterium]|jgi:hypothetical protein|nr:DUF4136 domain-containing protein [Flavobacteriaceae bacterium]
MKVFKLLPLLLIFIATSCVSVRVSSDYDKGKDFSQYKTFAFYKKGIDKVELSDLDKRRILKAIEADLLAKGFTKSENPDLLVNIFTKSREKIDVYDNRFYGGWYGGWGWNPWFYGGWYGPYGYGYGNNVIKSTEGTLFIDLIDAKNKELAWQGMGTGSLASSKKDISKKEERINEFVTEILAKYPPMEK